MITAVALLLLASCKGEEGSSSTGWSYNDPDNGGFEYVDYTEQETGPGLVLIEGGTFVMGRTTDDVMSEHNNSPRRVTMSSFYMDETEVKNLDWLEYLYWINKVYGETYPEVYRKALPDTLVWRDPLAFNEPYVQYYLRHPAYKDYPVVGVNWLQCVDFCNWRTDRVNEMILVREGIQKERRQIGAQKDNDVFNTEAYLMNQYEGDPKDNLRNYADPKGTRKVKMEDGILLPKYRLPTEAEWEFAALGLIGNSLNERVTERRMYPWNGHVIRSDQKDNLGQIIANTMRGRGDNMGVAGALNDNADVTAPVFAYWPNDYGLYNMAGNVSEWVMDVYRPLSAEDANEFRPFRGNFFMTQEMDPTDPTKFADKDSLGRIKWMPTPTDDITAQERRNYKKADNKNFLDGDWESTIDYYDPAKQNSAMMYDYGQTSMINDKARVYKGASWKDRAYWMSPGARRFLDEKQRTSTIGFRCAMDRVGSPIGF